MKIISADDALEKGLTRYFSGKPCKYGHIAERVISSSSCIECLRQRRKENLKKHYQYIKDWSARNPEKVREQRRRYYRKHKNRLDEYHKKWISSKKSSVIGE